MKTCWKQEVLRLIGDRSLELKKRIKPSTKEPTLTHKNL